MHITTHLFKQSLDVGELPQEQKSVFVASIFKKGKRSDPCTKQKLPSNFTNKFNLICKLFEHILVSKIMKLLHGSS